MARQYVDFTALLSCDAAHSQPTDLLQYDLHDHVKTFTVVNTFT
ncbi:hypothetical protein HAT91_02710 [Dickeya solani]|nr:hypothetical protein HAT91_02710 [Dickeya solani]